MKKHFAAILCLLLAGCTDADWDHVMNYGGMDEADARPVVHAAPATVVAAPAALGDPANADLCRAVAEQDAGKNGFDQATQARVYRQSYAQCLTIYTR